MTMPMPMHHPPLPAGIGRVIDAPEQMAPFVRDWSGHRIGTARCVVQPGHTDEVATLLRWCSAQRVPVVAQGGNTGLAGGATPDASGHALVLSLARMNRLREVDLANNTMTVDAGMVLQQVQEAAREADRFFPLSLGAQGSCTIGGNLSTNAGGTGVLRYGNARELCLGLEVVTPAGEVLHGLRGLRKDNTGYDLRNLYIGAEGTLGVITGATLKLFPEPAARVTAMAAVSSAAQAIHLLSLGQQLLGAELTAFELMSAYCVELVGRRFPDTPRIFADAHPWYVLLESSDLQSEAHAVERFEALMTTAFEQGVIVDAAIAQSQAQSLQFWQLRERIAHAQPRNIKHDISLPISRIAEFLGTMETVLVQAYPGIRIVALGHMGDGNLHYNVEPAQPLAQADFEAFEQRVHRSVFDVVEAMAGSMSAEHGIGSAKTRDLRRYKQPLALALMRSIKQALDPLGIMNPGKVLPEG
jgi:FAD/FMN-containing dehydrogenase